MIDTHIHLNDFKFADNLKDVIREANDVGVTTFIVSGYDLDSSKKAIEIAEQYQDVYATVGIHPSEVRKYDVDDISWLEAMLKHPKVVAVGEIGLDYYWDKTHKEKQMVFFKKQIALAKKHQLPIVIHSRDAIQDTFDCVKDSGVIGVMHCYSGSLEMAKAFVKHGFMLGIGGVVTYKNAHVKDIVCQIDSQYLLTETDAPYLPPVPHRGKMNYPKYIPLIVDAIARIKEVDSTIINQITTDNAYRIFRI